MSTPPAAWNASKMVTWWPVLTSSPAAVRPAGPEPTMATRLPLGGWTVCGSSVRCCMRPVGDEPLERADGDRLALLAAQAAALALALLGADATGHAGQGVVVEERLRGAPQVALGDEVDEARDVDPDRAAVDAGRLLALEAALGLGRGQQVAEAQVDLGEVVCADGRVLLRHRGPLDGHPLPGVEAGSLAHRAAPSGRRAPARPGMRQAARRSTASCSKSR